MKTREDYKDYYLEQLIENYGDMTERDYNSAKKFCYDEEWNLGEVGNMAEAIDGLGDAWTEYQKQYKEGFEIMNNVTLSKKNITSSGRWVVKTNEDQMDYIGNFFEGLPSCPQYVDWGYNEEKYAKAVNDDIFGWIYEDSDFSEADKKKITRNFLKLYKDYYNNGEPKDDLNTYYFEGEGPKDPRLIEWLHSVLSDKELNVPFTTWHYVESSKRNIKSSKAEELEMFENESVYGNESEFNDFKKNHPDFTITYLDWKKYLNGYEDDVEYEYEDETGNMYTWDMIKTEIDNWVDSGDFEEQNGELPEYFEKDGTPKYKKIYDDFWDISSNGAFSRINSSRRNNMRKTIKSDIDWESTKHAFDDKKYLIYKTGIDGEWEEFPFYGTDNAFTADEYERKGYKVEKNMIKSSYDRYNVNNDIYAVYVDDDLVEYVANTSIPGYEYISMNEYGDIAYRNSFRPTWFEKFKKKYGAISDVEEQSNVRMYGQKVLDAIEKSLKYDEYEKDMNENGTAYEFKGSDGKWYPIDPGTSSMAMCRTSNIPVRPVTSSRKPIKSGYTGTNVTVEYGPYGEEKDFPFYDMKGETVEQVDEAIGYYDEKGAHWGTDGNSYVILEDRAYSEDKIAVLEDDYDEWRDAWLDEDDSKIIGSSKKGDKNMKIQSKRLIKSGTSNFGSNDNVYGYDFPLVTYVAENYVYDEENDVDTEERDYDLDSLEYRDEIDNATDLATEMDIPLYDDYRDPDYAPPFCIKIRDGYYEGIWIEIKEGGNTEDLSDAEFDNLAAKINTYLDTLVKDYGWQKLGVTARFSNGETMYHKIDNSRESVTSGLTFRQAVQDFKAAGQWNDYYEMQQDWEAYKDGLERDGVISEKTRSTWGNPCTPEGFKKWNK